MTDARREYEEALAAYYAAQERLIEAKRHYDPKTAPEGAAQRGARYAASNAKRRAERNAPEALAARAERKAERLRWMQEAEHLAQRHIEIRENMPQELRILTRVGDRS